jgi:SAM-dependent methyltransferase
LIKNQYTKQDSSNYNLTKNLFYYLKQIVLFFFIYNQRKFFKKKKDILDYGSGSGELAIALSLFFKKKNIFTSDIFELNKKFIPKIKKHYSLHKNQLKGKKFDIILMRHVLEHIYDLNIFFNKIKKNLKNNNSLLIIEIPNFDSFWRKIMRNRWPGYFYPFHYYVFSKQFLKRYLLKNGLKVINEQNLEPAIIGSFLLTFGINKSICKFFSLIFYPIQFLISKMFSSSEAILMIVKKK